MATIETPPAIDIEALPLMHESQRELLRDHPDWVTFEPFSPVGPPRIVFDRFNPHTGGRQIHAVDATGGNVTNLSNNPNFYDTTPAWSPDQTEIVFARASSGTGTSSLWLMNADGSGQKPLTTPPPGKWEVEPIWSPDGRRIAFSRSYEIWVADARRGTAEPVITYPTNPYAIDHMPTWRADGGAIAFCREWLGFGVIAVADTAAIPTSNVRYVTVPNKARWDAWPAWSPKADVIAFTRNDGTDMQIWVINGDGTVSTERPLSHPDTAHGVYDQAPCWSPTGQALAFDRTIHVTSHVWTMDAGGANQVDVSAIGNPGDMADYLPNWA